MVNLGNNTQNVETNNFVREKCRCEQTTAVLEYPY